MKKLITIILLAISANFATITGLYSAENNFIKKLKYVRTIEIAEPTTEGLYSFALDKTVYEHSGGTKGNFCDLRIIADTVTPEIPYRIRKKYTSGTEKYLKKCSTKIISLKKLESNRIEVVVKNIDKKLTPTSLTLITPLRNFDKKISVTPGNGKDKWDTAKTVTSSIFDYSAIIALSNNTIKLPLTKEKFYRIIISNFSEQKLSKRMEIIKEQRSGKKFSEIRKIIKNSSELKIEKILFKTSLSRTLRKKAVLAEIKTSTISTITEKRNTEIILDIARQPVTHIEFSANFANFSRKIDIYTSVNQKNWKHHSTGNISSISIGNFKKNCLTITMPETTSRFLKITVHNEDAPPITGIKIKTSGSVYGADFLLSSQEKAPKLYYGGNLLAPKYDIEDILAKLANPQFLETKLGPEMRNSAYSAKPEKTSFLNSRILLYIIIGAMVLILGFALFKTMNSSEFS